MCRRILTVPRHLALCALSYEIAALVATRPVEILVSRETRLSVERKSAV